MFPKDAGSIVNDSYTGTSKKLKRIAKTLHAEPRLRDHRMDVEMDVFFEKYEAFRSKLRMRDWGIS